MPEGDDTRASPTHRKTVKVHYVEVTDDELKASAVCVGLLHKLRKRENVRRERNQPRTYRQKIWVWTRLMRPQPGVRKCSASRKFTVKSAG